MVTPQWRWVGMLNTNLPLMKRNIYHPAIGCSCWLHTWPTLLQSVCKYRILTEFKVFMYWKDPPHANRDAEPRRGEALRFVRAGLSST